MRIERSHLLHIAAPMVNQSDLPFRCLVESHGATMSYTQMLIPERLLNDKDYYEFHTRDLTLLGERRAKPVVVQLCGNDVDEVVRAGRKLQSYCDGIDLNLGCPLDAARDARYGAYLLGQKDWPLVEDIVSSMATSFTVPVSAKLRLCQPVAKTHELAQRLEARGASWITLHARTVSSKRRRQGAADLDVVKDLKTQLTIPTISNGNVRTFNDLERNLVHTGADGLMVGEALLGNPCIFTDGIPDPVAISLEYIDLCNKYPGTATLSTVQAHIRRFVEFQCERTPWYNRFKTALTKTANLEDIEQLVRDQVCSWRDTSGERKQMPGQDGEDAVLGESFLDS